MIAGELTHCKQHSKARWREAGFSMAFGGTGNGNLAGSVGLPARFPFPVPDGASVRPPADRFLHRPYHTCGRAIVWGEMEGISSSHPA